MSKSASWVVACPACGSAAVVSYYGEYFSSLDCPNGCGMRDDPFIVESFPPISAKV